MPFDDEDVQPEEIRRLVRYLRRSRGRKRAKKGGKNYAERAHARRRALQRFGLPAEAVTAMERQIRRKESTFVAKETNTRTLHIVSWKSQRFLVVYVKTRKNIVTFLPQSRLDAVLRELQQEEHK